MPKMSGGREAEGYKAQGELNTKTDPGTEREIQAMISTRPYWVAKDME
jgi:hypothetical protein